MLFFFRMYAFYFHNFKNNNNTRQVVPYFQPYHTLSITEKTPTYPFPLRPTRAATKFSGIQPFQETSI